MNQKWTALLVALGLTAAVTAGCGNQAAPSSRQAASGPVTETMKPFNVHQVVAGDNEKGRTVMWEMPLLVGSRIGDISCLLPSLWNAMFCQ